MAFAPDLASHSTVILDIHGAPNGAALSLVAYCDECGLETDRWFVRGFPTLTLAIRARMKATNPQFQLSLIAA